MNNLDELLFYDKEAHVTLRVPRGETVVYYRREPIAKWHVEPVKPEGLLDTLCGLLARERAVFNHQEGELTCNQ